MIELQYLINTGNTWTSTGIANKLNTRLHVSYFDTEPVGSIHGSYISYIGSGDKYLRLGYDTANAYFYFSNRGNFVYNPLTLPEGCSIDISPNELYINDVLIATTSPSGINTGKTIVIGADTTSGSDAVRINPVKLGEIIIYDGDTVEADYIPVLNENNVACWYDKVSSSYVNNVQGTYEAGPVLHIFTPSKISTKFESTGGTDTFVINAETSWTAETPSIFTVSPLTGDTGETTVTITAADYTGETRQEETITFTDNDGYSFDYNIRQKAPRGAGYSSLYMGEINCDTMYFGEYEVRNIYLGETEVFSSGPFVGLKVSPKAMSFKKTGGTNSMAIKSSEPWTASTDAEWLSLSQATGDSGKTTISVTALENEGEEARTATIEVHTASFSASVVITQYVVQNTDYLQVYYTVPAAGDYSIINDLSNARLCFSHMRINSGEWVNVESTATLQTGRNLIEFELINPTEISKSRDGIFRQNPYITTVITNKDLLYLGNKTIADRQYGQKIFELCSNLKEVILNEGLLLIGSLVFNDTAIEEIEIPYTVRTIGHYTFANCHSLKTVYIGDNINGSNLQAISMCMFESCDSIESIYSYAMTNAATEFMWENYGFYAIAQGGVLHTPAGSNYTKWMQNNQYWLGYYDWTEIKDL